RPAELWSARTRRLAVDFLGDVLPPRLGPGRWSALIEASIDTVAMSILALAIAVSAALLLAPLAARPVRVTGRPSIHGRFGRAAIRLVLLLFRAVPAPIWAFLMVLILFPGLVPGAVALAIYTVGVLGRLFAEAFEDCDPGPSIATDQLGATPTQTFFYATLPTTSTRLIALSLYRGEVIARETVVVGVVGAGGLGQLMNQHLAARDFAAVIGAIAALLVITFAVDAIGAGLRRRLRAC
ncbi:MAG: PhnE/PtxC family ABC transporter permease, partial [Acidimicrobiales bacterium]